MQVTSFLVEGTTILWGSVREFENWRKLTLMGYNENCEILSHFRVLRYFSILFLWSAGSLALTHCNLSELSSNLKLWKRKFSETNHVRAGRKKTLLGVFRDGCRRHQLLKLFADRFAPLCCFSVSEELSFQGDYLKEGLWGQNRTCWKGYLWV